MSSWPRPIRYPLNNSPASRPLRDWSELKIPIGAMHDRTAAERARRMKLREEVAPLRSGRRVKDIVVNALSKLLDGI